MIKLDLLFKLKVGDLYLEICLLGNQCQTRDMWHSDCEVFKTVLLETNYSATLSLLEKCHFLNVKLETGICLLLV